MEDWEDRTIPLNEAAPSQARIFISGALSGAAQGVERAMDAAPSEKEYKELAKILAKLEIAASEFWRRGQLEVIHGKG